MVSSIIAFLAGGAVMFTGLYFGLKWQVQIKQGELPKVEIPNPIQPIIQARNDNKVRVETNEVLDEWLNGAKEVR